MASHANSIRGSRVGSGSSGEQDYGVHVERTAVSYWDANGNETVRYFSANINENEIPEQIDSPTSGLPAGRDKNNPPGFSKTELYKTHLAYVKERRTPEEGQALLDEALERLRKRRSAAASAPAVEPTQQPSPESAEDAPSSEQSKKLAKKTTKKTLASKPAAKKPASKASTASSSAKKTTKTTAKKP